MKENFQTHEKLKKKTLPCYIFLDDETLREKDHNLSVTQNFPFGSDPNDPMDLAKANLWILYPF
jgi:hypothetical protein